MISCSSGKSTLAASLQSSPQGADQFGAGTTVHVRATFTTLDESGDSFGALSEMSESQSTMCMTVLDTPGHLELAAETAAALRISDGAVLAVDCMDGVCRGTRSAIGQAVRDEAVLVVALCKMDLLLNAVPANRCWHLSEQLSEINQAVSTASQSQRRDRIFHPPNGNVVFCAASAGWAFTLDDFARMYASKFRITPDAIRQRLWGDHFFDPQTKEWSTTGSESHRSFEILVLDPIRKVAAACMNNQTAKLHRMLQALSLSIEDDALNPDEHDAKPARSTHLLRRVLSLWLPLRRAFFSLLSDAIPSPTAAQSDAQPSYLSAEVLQQAQACSPAWPLAGLVAKFTPLDGDSKRAVALVRVLSGTLRAGQAISVMPARNGASDSSDAPSMIAMTVADPSKRRSAGGSICNGEREGEEEEKEKKSTITLVRLEQGGPVPLREAVAGDICGVTGLEHALTSQGCITDRNGHGSSPARPEWTVVSSCHGVVKPLCCAVEPRCPRHLPVVVRALSQLPRSFLGVDVSVEASGEHCLRTTGPFQLALALRALRDLIAPVEVTIFGPVVNYRETVTTRSAEPCMSKSPNRHSRLWVAAEPISEPMTIAAERGALARFGGDMRRAGRFIREQGWTDASAAARIVAFGPRECGSNMLVDATKGDAGLQEVSPYVGMAFQWVAAEGVLCEEPLRGVRMSVMDCVYNADAIHRGAGQVLPMSRRAMYGAMLMSAPRLLEPSVILELCCPHSALPALLSFLRRKCQGSDDQSEGYLSSSDAAMTVEVKGHSGPDSDSDAVWVDITMPMARCVSLACGDQVGGRDLASRCWKAMLEDSDAPPSRLENQVAGRGPRVQCVFGGWRRIGGVGDSSNEEAERREEAIVTAVRRRKGLKPEIRPLSDFKDKN